MRDKRTQMLACQNLTTTATNNVYNIKLNIQFVHNTNTLGNSTFSNCGIILLQFLD